MKKHFFSPLIILQALFLFSAYYLLSFALSQMAHTGINQSIKQIGKTSSIALYNFDEDSTFYPALQQNYQLKLRTNLTKDSLDIALENGTIQAALTLVEKGDKVSIELRYLESYPRSLKSSLQKIKKQAIADNFRKNQLSPQLAEPFDVEEQNIVSFNAKLEQFMQIINQSIAYVLSLLMLLASLWMYRKILLSIYEEREQKSLSPKQYRNYFFASIAWSSVFILVLSSLLKIGFKHPETGLIQTLLFQLHQLISWSNISYFILAFMPLFLLFALLFNIITLFSPRYREAASRSRYLFLICILIFCISPSFSVETDLLKYGFPLINSLNIIKEILQAKQKLPMTALLIYLGSSLLYSSILFALLNKKIRQANPST